MTASGRASSPPAAIGGTILGVEPRAWVRPESVEGAAACLAEGARDGARFAFVGGGTAIELGAPPRAVDVALSTAGLARIVEHEPADQVVTVEAGVRLGPLQSALAAHGQRLALDPPRAAEATIGGLVATGAFGPLRTRYGGLRDLIIGVAFARADGVIARGGGKVVKNVAGFDLPKLMVGSLGVLGLVVRASFRLHPLPEEAATVLAAGLDPAAVWALAARLRAGKFEPAAVAALAHGRERFQVAVRFEGFASAVAREVARIQESEAATGVPLDRLPRDAATAWWAEHEALRGGATLAGGGAAGAVFSARFGALPAAFAAVAGEALAPVRDALAAPATVYYPTLGLGFLAGAAPDATGPALTDLVAALGRARAWLGERGGHLVLERAPGAVRARVDVWGPPPAALGLMRRLKERFDPEVRLNPGRFVGGL